MDLPSFPLELVGHTDELEQIVQTLAAGSNCLVTGVPGSGRRTLIRAAVERVGVLLLEIDCLRTTSANQFLQVLADRITATFVNQQALMLMQAWSLDHPFTMEGLDSERVRLVWQGTPNQDWRLFQALLDLPQLLAEELNKAIVMVFQNFPHLRSWDRQGQWETYLGRAAQKHHRVSYVLVTTVAEAWVHDQTLQVIQIPPLSNTELQPWLISEMATAGLKFDPDTRALDLFLGYVQGHLGDAIALARRVWLEYQTLNSTEPGLLQAHHIRHSMVGLVEDISMTFESLLLLLPPSQIRVLESLALDPTDSPHAHSYIKKHQLSRGGSLQGALNSLEQKGLIYGSDYGYRIALPLLDFWLKQRLV
jgi:hypothetical protein